MLPGPTYICQCSICGKHISQDTIYSCSALAVMALGTCLICDSGELL